MIESNSIVTGTIVEEQKNYYVVLTSQSPQIELRCTLKGALLKRRDFRMSAGDSVSAQIINIDSREGVICEVSPRKSFLPRPSLANLSQVMFINSFKHPSLDTEAVDRFLFSAAAYGIEAVIVFNKMDLLDENETRKLEAAARYYSDIGYKILYTSTYSKQGVAELIDICRHKTCAFTGLSGVGKSSLLSLIFPKQGFKTSEVSGTVGRGTHTTTHIKLLSLDGGSGDVFDDGGGKFGGFIADTPGFAFVDIPKVDEETVASHFPEIEKATGLCRFNNCIHDTEPGCEVVRLVESNEIAPWRLEHYLKIYREMIARRKMY